MYACVVRTPEGHTEFLLAQRDDRDQPILPVEYELLSIMAWSGPALGDYCLNCSVTPRGHS